MIWRDAQNYIMALKAKGFLVVVDREPGRHAAYTMTIGSIDEGLRSTTGRTLVEAVENMLKDWENDSREDHGITS